jgi:hypothetical protein
VQERRSISVDWRLQGIWVGRVLIYWSAMILYFGLAAGVSQYCDHPQWSLSQHLSVWIATVSPWLPSVLLILPLVIFDVLRLSQQLIRPVVRLRTQLNKMVKNANCTPFILRADDCWGELVKPVNDMQDYLISLQMELHKSRQALKEAGIDLTVRNPKTICPDIARIQFVNEVSTEASSESA